MEKEKRSNGWHTNIRIYTYNDALHFTLVACETWSQGGSRESNIKNGPEYIVRYIYNTEKGLDIAKGHWEWQSSDSGINARAVTALGTRYIPIYYMLCRLYPIHSQPTTPSHVIHFSNPQLKHGQECDVYIWYGIWNIHRMQSWTSQPYTVTL